jgi:hypothetical protein
MNLLPDVGILGLAAALLILVAATRVVAGRLQANLAAWAGEALVGIALMTAILLAFDHALELRVFSFAAAALAGVYWAALVEHRPLGRLNLALSAVGAAALVGTLSGLALNPQWWHAPLALVTLLALGVGWQVAAAVRGHAAVKATAAQETGLPAGPPPPEAVQGKAAARARAGAKPSSPPSAPAKVVVICPSCGLMGQVAAVGPAMLKCPRCGQPVARPASKPVSPTVPAKGEPKEPKPRKRASPKRASSGWSSAKKPKRPAAKRVG